MNLRKSSGTRLGAAIALAVTVACAAPAHAASTFYNFVFADSNGAPTPGSFSGTFEVDGGLVVGITGSGTIIGTITGLLPAGTFPQAGANDNVFNVAAPYLTFNGVSFSTALAGDVNLYWNGTTYETYQDVITATSAGTLEVSLAPPRSEVPEPLSLALFGMGLAGLGLVRSRAA